MKLSMTKTALCAAILAASAGATAEEKEYSSLQEFLKDSTPTGDFNLRYETADRDDDSTRSKLFTLRSRLGIKTASYKGFSAVVEIEDVREVLGVDNKDGSLPIADEEVTEVDVAYVQYKNDKVTAKLGRQVIVNDGMRFIGHVAWRQDRQTFDAARVMLTPTKGLNIDLGYIYKRNRIFGERLDTNSSDILTHISYATPVGKLVGYYYGLDDDLEGTPFPQSDTFGGYFAGATKGDVSFLYRAEFASQDIELDNGTEFDTSYYNLEAGIKVSGVTFKLGQESLGSDDGQASFTTPLATLAKYNGWGDLFLGGTFNPVGMPAGLVDTSFTVAGSLAGVKLTATYHNFTTDEDLATGSDDYGSEFDLTAIKKLKGGFTLGFKYAAFMDEEDNTFVPADTDRMWIWTNFKF